MHKTYLVAGASLLGVAISFYSGYLFAESKLHKLYNEQMEAEIARTKAFYAGVSKKSWPTPQDLADSVGVEVDPILDEAIDAIRKYSGKDVTIIKDGIIVPAEDGDFDGMEDEEDEKLEAALIEQNVWQEEQQIVTTGRTPEIPYQITEQEFAENKDDYDQVDVTWYAGDDVLTDENDGLVEDHKVVGQHNLDLFGTGHDPNIVLVRNERLKVDYSIARDMGKYTHVVLGLQHSSEPFERIRRTPRGADE